MSIKDNIRKSKAFGVGKGFMGEVLKRHFEVNKLVKRMCKPCKVLAKKSLRKPNFNREPCDACRPLLDEAIAIANSIDLDGLKDV